jgi:hypothetical protein
LGVRYPVKREREINRVIEGISTGKIVEGFGRVSALATGIGSVNQVLVR